MDNLLRRDYLDGVDSLAEYLQYNFTVPCSGVRGENKLECSFSDLCSGQCNDNQVIPLFNLIYRNASSRLHPNFRLTYPTMHLYNDEYYVGEHFAGVKIDPNTNVISRVKVVVLYFRTDRQTTEVSQVLNNWETSLFDYVENFDHPFLNMTVNSDAMIAREVRTNGMTCVPFFSFSVAAVVIFIFATNSREHFVFSHNVVMAILGIAGPLMATGTAFGFLFLFGFPFNSITLVMPFLIIGVGCDDVFIIIHAMRKTDKSESLEDRIAETMEEAGPSITVTSATNCLSFAIGIATPTPAISLFCLYTCVAVAVDFVYQLTFFVAVLVYEEKRLMKLQKVGEEKKIEAAMERRPKQVLSIQNSIRSTAGAHPPPANPNGIVSRYCRFLKDWKTRLCLLLVLCGYWTASYYGCKTMEIKMDTTNLIMNDSPLNHIAWIYERFLWSEGQLVMVFVNNPPDLTKSENLHEVLELVNRFETLPYSMGKNSTSIWLRSFLYQSSLYHNNKGFNGLLQEWLEDSEGGGARWNDMLRLKKDENGTILGIDKFMFATACAMGDDANWSTREKLQKQWRGVAHEYEHFNVTVFQSYSFYIDQLDSIGATTMSTVIWAAITMDLACLLMIPGINSILTSTIAMISINIGVFGLLSMWRVNLDPITMCTTLMSIGFSVDFTAHISYHYYRNPTSWTTDERLADALKSIGWPMIQAASSTVLCIFPLMFNTSYMVWVFVKTILLVTVLGLLHGIIFLPALLLTSGDLSRLFGGDSIQPEKPEKLGEISQASSFSSGNSETALVKSNSTELRTLPQERGSG
ncbi:SSD domain-containing protein [Caenorhabditis elegans]|nr:SSD domain-containing protein [Caenorhabditis elegans]CTQ86900.1 SSD domain-containing protein [Caenorhabditis elegans]|eukprot:NP_001300201.1 PaTched Related family [Caenorhabditis elegans]